MKKTWTRIVYRIVSVILILIIFLNVLFLISTSGLKQGQIPRIFGYTPLIENTGSMEPLLKRGDLIFVKENENIEKEDVIAWYNTEGGITTHRIIELNKDGKFITKGDSNNVEDRNAVDREQIIGVYYGKLAGAGNLFMYLQKPQGIVTMVLLILFIGITSLWLIEYRENKKLKGRGEEHEEQGKKE